MAKITPAYFSMEISRDVIAIEHVSGSSLLDTTRATKQQQHTNPQSTHTFFEGGFNTTRYISILHPWELERWSPSSLEHPIHKHPVFSKASEVEFPGAGAVFSRSEYLEVSPGDEAGVSHADVH